ncbi:MAG: alpha-ketoglutarate-dependent dioxygenase AlkB [Alphaproteobacteria bacterium]|nr:alpha-ketoglutarate-dependent dioxygenase AlkB [Alphaproteobacteria bacterium]
MVQQLLFGGGPVRLGSLDEARRIDLGAGAWLVHRPGWVSGQDVLFDHLFRETRWRSEQRRMYEKTVDVPRLLARVPDDGPGHPILPAIAERLSAAYGMPLVHTSLALYRDGADSVAPHGDRVGALRDDCVIGIVSVGHPRRFQVRPAGGGLTRSFDLGWGDLLVMGGTCQRTFEHGIPKVRHAGPRISIQLRPDPTTASLPPPGSLTPP